MEFEYPIVTTKHLLIKEYKKLLETNKNVLVFDLGHDVQIFEPYIPNKIIKADSVLSFTEGVLLSISNAYKWINEELLREMLFDYSNRLREISLGGVITNEGYDELIEKAIDLKDSFEVEENKKMRFLINPHYKRKVGEDINKLKTDLINKYLAIESTKDTFDIIYEEITCYNLNQKKLTKSILKYITGLSYATIKLYLKEYPCLNEAFLQVNNLSGTSAQELTRYYNRKKISKVANCTY